MTTLVLALHGLRGHGAAVRAHLAPLLRPGLEFQAPDGPLALNPNGPQRGWFDVTDVSPDNRPARVRGARAALDGLIDAAMAQARPDRLVLLGFSQGAIMAIDALGRGKVAEIIAFAGRYAMEEPATPRPGARALLIGGARDKTIPPLDVLRAHDHLTRGGVACDLLIEPRVGHEFGPLGLAEARAFLA